MLFPVEIDYVQTKKLFNIIPDSLPKGSHNKIVVKCTDCKTRIIREYRHLYKYHRCSSIRNNEKRCFVCKEWFPFEYFHKTKFRKGGITAICKICINDTSSTIKAYKKKNKKIKNSLSSGNVKTYIKSRVGQFRARAKRNSLEFDLDFKFLFDLWNSQNGLCYYSQRKMIAGHKKYSGCAAWDSPSLDRKDPYRGYTKDNVVWCTYAVNSFKQALTEEQFRKIVKEIKWK